MKKSVLFLMMACVAMVFTGCKPKFDAKGHEDENLQNKEIRSEFYGVQFGASKRDVIAHFQQNGLVLDKKASNDDILDFYYTPDARPFIFLGYQEPFYRACAVFKGGKFSQVEFYNMFQDKHDAEQMFQARQKEYLSRYYEGDLRHKEKLPKTVIDYSVAKGLNGVNSYVAFCQTKTLAGDDAYCVEVGFQKR